HGPHVGQHLLEQSVARRRIERVGEGEELAIELAPARTVLVVGGLQACELLAAAIGPGEAGGGGVPDGPRGPQRGPVGAPHVTELEARPVELDDGVVLRHERRLDLELVQRAPSDSNGGPIEGPLEDGPVLRVDHAHAQTDRHGSERISVARVWRVTRLLTSPAIYAPFLRLLSEACQPTWRICVTHAPPRSSRVSSLPASRWGMAPCPRRLLARSLRAWGSRPPFSRRPATSPRWVHRSVRGRPRCRRARRTGRSRASSRSSGRRSSRCSASALLRRTARTRRRSHDRRLRTRRRSAAPARSHASATPTT